MFPHRPCPCLRASNGRGLKRTARGWGGLRHPLKFIRRRWFGPATPKSRPALMLSWSGDGATPVLRNINMEASGVFHSLAWADTLVIGGTVDSMLIMPNQDVNSLHPQLGSSAIRTARSGSSVHLDHPASQATTPPASRSTRSADTSRSMSPTLARKACTSMFTVLTQTGSPFTGQLTPLPMVL